MFASIVYALLTFVFTVAPVIHASRIVALNVTTLTSTRLPKPISDGTAVLLGETIYLHGGCDSPNGNEFNNVSGVFQCHSISNASYAFDISSQSVRTLSDMPTPRYRHATVALKDQVILLGGRSLSDALIATVDVRIEQTNSTVSIAVLAHLSLSYSSRSTMFLPKSGLRTT
jgi:Galactose oxidase, central domain